MEPTVKPFLWSCCGDNMRGTIWEDIQRCPSCHENCCGEEEDFEDQ